LPALATDNQTITINTTLGTPELSIDIYGNGTGATGQVMRNDPHPTGNIVNVVDGAKIFGGQVTGARGEGGEGTSASGNFVNISGGEIIGTIFGARVNLYSGVGEAINNTVSISTFGKTYQIIRGGYTSGNSGDMFTGNTLNLAAGNTADDVRDFETINFTSSGNAGIATLDTTVRGGVAVAGTLVKLNTNAYDITFGGEISGTGGIEKTGAGTLNLSGTNTYIGDTTVSGGTLAGNTNSLRGAITNNANVEFAQTTAGTYAGSMSGTGTLTKTGAGTLTLSGTNTYTGNTTVSAGTLEITGGLTNSNVFVANTAALSLRGGGGVNQDVTLQGGVLNIAPSGTALFNPINIGGKLLANGGTLNFYVPTNAGDMDTMLTVKGTTGDSDITGSQVNVGINGASSVLQVGNKIRLIVMETGALTGEPSNATSKGEGMQGVTLKYEFDLTTTANELIATLSRIGVNEQTKALSEGYLSGLILLNQGADLIAGRGIAEAVNAARVARENPGLGLAIFGTLSGGWSRYNTGSHVEMSSLSVLAGLSYGADLAPGHLTLGGFFEYGNGSYDTYNSFSNAAAVHGNGDLYHAGGGILGHFDFADTGIYTEASFRAGGVHNEYSSGDLRDALGRSAGYNSSSAYYGLHLGAGYVLNITDKASLDFSGKYFWTRQSGDSVTLTTGEPVKFDDADSHRLRLGGRFAYAVNKYVAPYVGGAWEHEFDGQVKAATNGFAIDAPSLRGDTGIGELGLTLTPRGRKSALSVDLGVQGYVGKREGVTGSLQLKLEF
jgi:autotransporter-associated beta strand protein